MKHLAGGLSAGILISIGGAVYLSCDNKYVGAILFSVALLCICYKGYALFTGKVGYMAERHDKEAWSALLLALLGNALATVLIGLCLRYAIPAIGAGAATLCAAKLTQAPWQTFVRAILCGVLMYLAVSVYREHKTPMAILFCVPVFILSGFEHSIANLFYFGASGVVSLRAFCYLWIVILGNAAGGLLLPVLQKIK